MREKPQIAVLNDTLFVSVWTGAGPKTSYSAGVYGRIFSSKLVPAGHDFWINDSPFTECAYAKIAIKPDGSGFWVFWRDNRTGNFKVYAREVSKDGVPKGASFLVSEDSRLNYLWFLDVAIDTKGNLTAVWGGDLEGLGSQVQLRRFDKDGKPLGASENVTSKPGGLGQDPTVAVSIDSLGNSVLAWDQEETNKDLHIYAQRYSPENTPLGTAFRVSNEKDGFSQFLPVLKLRNGKIYCFWTESRDSTVLRIKCSIMDFNYPLSVNESTEGTTVDNFTLFQNYPNPFNPSTTIRFRIKNMSNVKLVIYNILGYEVKELINKIYTPGEYSYVWDGKNESGIPVSSEIYIYKIETDQGVLQKKMVLLK